MSSEVCWFHVMNSQKAGNMIGREVAVQRLRAQLGRLLSFSHLISHRDRLRPEAGP